LLLSKEKKVALIKSEKSHPIRESFFFSIGCTTDSLEKWVIALFLEMSDNWLGLYKSKASLAYRKRNENALFAVQLSFSTAKPTCRALLTQSLLSLYNEMEACKR